LASARLLGKRLLQQLPISRTRTAASWVLILRWSAVPTVVMTLLILPSFPIGSADPTSLSYGGDYGGTNPPPPGASYGVDWTNGSFTEVTNPLARFKKYTLTDPDNDLIAVLPPLSRPPTAGRATSNLSDVTNAEIGDAMVRLGMTKQLLKDAVNSALGDAESASTDKEAAIREIDTGDFSDAVHHLRTWLRVTLVCGSGDPFVYSWVAIIPVPLDCNGSDASDEIVAVVDVNDLTFDDVVVIDGSGTPRLERDVPDTADFTMRTLLNLSPLTTTPTGSFVIGFSYRSNGVGITCRLDQLSSVRLVLSGLASASNPDVGSVTFTPVTTFNAGSRYHVTFGDKVSRELSVSPAIDTNLGTFNLGYSLHSVASERRITILAASSTTARDAYVYSDHGDGSVVALEWWAPGLPFEVRAQSSVSAVAGKKILIQLGNLDGAGRPLSEVRGTAWEGTSTRSVFYLVGLPGRTRILFDHGTTTDKVASVDVALQGADYFRALALDERTPTFPWNQTVADFGRSYSATAPADPQGAVESVPFVYQALHLEKADSGLSIAKGNSNLVGVYDVKMNGIGLGEADEEFTHWALRPTMSCTESCSGELERGESVRAHLTSAKRFELASLPLGQYMSCPLLHEGTTECV
jgi:hypothetical protein